MTALPISKVCGVEINKTTELREIFSGDWQGLSFDELEERHSDDYKIWLNDIGNAKTTNGESVVDMTQRIWNAVSNIVKNEAGKTIVIVTHATPIRALLCRIKKLELSEMKSVPWVSNASVSVVSVDSDWSIEQEGCDKHLAELKTKFPANV